MHNLDKHLQNTKAIIFDFDGVILESASIKTEAFLELFANYPQHQPAILQYHLDNLSVSRYTKFEWICRELLGRPYTAVDRERLGNAFSAIVLDKILSCPFVPGVLETLQALRNRCLAFVASGTPQEELAIIVQQRGLADYFTEVWGTPMKKVEIIHLILERYGFRRQEVLFVGDGASDYWAAMETGIPFLARETSEQQHYWQELDVPRVTDLREFCTLIKVSDNGQVAKLAEVVTLANSSS